MKTAIKVLLFVTLLVIIAGLGVGVYYVIDHFSIKAQFGEPTPILFNDGSKTVGMKMSFTDRNIIGEDVNETGTVMFAMDKNDKIIEKGAGYVVHFHNQTYGITTTVANRTGQIRITVDPAVIRGAIKNRQRGTKRLLEEDPAAADDDGLSLEELTAALNE